MPDIENLLNIEDEVTQVLSDLGVDEKLNEMDDFMNQNDLKVQITNENAVVTGLVTYTCTVKDKNNTALANKVVEWYKGTTLIGIDATDSNGVSTFSHRVTEADIYDVHAIVRGTHAGDDIRMFVKDKKNLLDYNSWSCGDYLNNTSGVINSSENITVTVSSDWSENGNKCFLSEFDAAAVFDLFRILPGDFENGDYIMRVSIKSDCDCSIVFFNEENVNRVQVPASDEVTHVVITGAADNERYLSCRVSGLENGKYYHDNLSLELSN